MNQRALSVNDRGSPCARSCPSLPAFGRSEGGVTLIEILLVIVLIALMSAFAIPKLSDAMMQQSVSSARVAFVGMYATARSTAIQRGAQSALILANNVVTIRSQNPVTSLTETVGNSLDLNGRYGVTVQPAIDTLQFDSRGIGLGAIPDTVSITKGWYATQIVISAVGRVIE